MKKAEPGETSARSDGTRPSVPEAISFLMKGYNMTHEQAVKAYRDMTEQQRRLVFVKPGRR